MSASPAIRRLAKLELLPREILGQIIEYLDRSTIPEESLRHQPSLKIFTTPAATIPSLKCLSLVSRSLHYATVPILFKHCHILQMASNQAITKFQIKPFSWLYAISDLANFLEQHQLGSRVQTFTLCVEQFYPAYYAESIEFEHQWRLAIKEQWQALLQQVSTSLERLTILASPYCLGILLSIRLHPYIDQALYMPYHLLVLERPRPLSPMRNAKISSTSSSSILTDIPWTSILLNEGSFLRYHADNAPGWQHKLLSTPGDDENSRFPAAFYEKIESFEYIAMFPTPRHILDCIDAIKPMKKLKNASFQVVQLHDPDPDFYQRGFVGVETLAANCQDVYQAIFENLISIPASQRNLVSQTPFQYLKKLRSTDLFNDESPSMWQALVEEADRCGWELQRDQRKRGRNDDGTVYQEQLVRRSPRQSKPLYDSGFAETIITPLL